TGMQLAKHPAIKAIGFTGSYRAGKALFDAAAARPEPIPVYAEMGSTNPVFILPEAMRERGRDIAKGYASSVTMGAGQFCTNPGLLFYSSTNGDSFKNNIAEAFTQTTGAVMLTQKMGEAYRKGMEQHLRIDKVSQLAKGKAVETDGGGKITPLLLAAEGETLRDHQELTEEVFGPGSIVVSTGSKEEMLSIAKSLSGHLTATVHGTDRELEAYRDLLTILEQKVGRIVINGFPTGVEVCSAMVHGGPFPATTDSKTTSVGTAAIYRFVRPVCYQQMPEALLPEELRNKNTLHILRQVNGERTTKNID
ncbi:MAG: aldehyde dehydrogenase family protein, partial [Sphingobacteriales bacterium]